jgi:hypothetical protein
MFVVFCRLLQWDILRCRLNRGHHSVSSGCRTVRMALNSAACSDYYVIA